MLRIFCIKCNRLTNHNILKEHKKSYHHDDYPEMGIDWAEGKWQIIQCKGCEEVNFREVWINSEDFDHPDGGYIEDIYLYPPRNKNFIPLKHFNDMPFILRDIYKEIHSCYNNKKYLLCAGGIRAIIEGLCAENNIKNGPVEDKNNRITRKKNLEGKINGLHEKGLITKKHAEILHELRFLGNEALHELEKPSTTELKSAIMIIENTLENLYELEETASQLKIRKQRRKGKTKK